MKKQLDRGKLNKLLMKWPYGTVSVQPWLSSQGIPRQFAEAYCRSKWLERIGYRAYIRPGQPVEWTGGLYALQSQLKLPVHAGGKTALALQGYAHFLPLGRGYPVYLFGAAASHLPRWFLQHDWEVKLQYTTMTLFSGDQDFALTEKDLGTYSIKLSSPERAIFEVLEAVPHHQGFEEAKLLMEGLMTLRLKVVHSLLSRCRSIKVKRLFLFLAEECRLPWVKRLDLSKVKLGNGKRVIEKGGRFNEKYQIAVPVLSEGEAKGA